MILEYEIEKRREVHSNFPEGMLAWLMLKLVRVNFGDRKNFLQVNKNTASLSQGNPYKYSKRFFTAV